MGETSVLKPGATKTVEALAMDTLDRNLLLSLAGRSTWPSVSIYLPADHTGIRTDADRLRLRNLTKQARERLLADGVSPAEADSLLARVVDLSVDGSAWPGGPYALAYFADARGAEALWLDVTMPELAVSGDRFYLRPLYAALHDEPPVWALALDSNHTRLFMLDHAKVTEVELPAGTPTSLGEETQYDNREESLQYHTMPSVRPVGGSGQQAAAMFHGHGGAGDFDKVSRERFASDLDRGVVERIGAESTDLLVPIGVEYLLDDYRATSAYAHLVPERVEGSPARLSPAEIQKAVLAVLAPRYAGLRQADVEEYRAYAGTGRTSSDAPEILAAAAAGRVKTLIMDDSAGPWGFFDRGTFETTSMCTVEPRYLRDTMDTARERDMFDCGWDLIDLAAAETLKHGGTVRAYRGEDSPVSGAVAVFRY
jgi:hypothetical protein